jgi:hypothetical protein
MRMAASNSVAAASCSLPRARAAPRAAWTSASSGRARGRGSSPRPRGGVLLPPAVPRVGQCDSSARPAWARAKRGRWRWPARERQGGAEAPERVEDLTAAEVELPRLEAGRRRAWSAWRSRSVRTTRRARRARARSPPGSRHVVRLPVVALGPELVAVGRVHQLDRHAEPVARAPDAALEDGTHAQPLPDRAHVRPRAAELEGRRAGGDPHAANAPERRDQLLGQAVAEVLLVPGRAQVGEGQHGDRGRPGLLRGRGLRRRAHRLQREEQLARRREALLGTLGEAAAHDAVEPRRERPVPHGRRRVVAQDGGL